MKQLFSLFLIRLKTPHVCIINHQFESSHR